VLAWIQHAAELLACARFRDSDSGISRGWIAQRHLIMQRQWAVLQIDKDRDDAACVLQRFFLMVKDEVDRVIREEKKRRKAKRTA
jgi:hypothetical protein